VPAGAALAVTAALLVAAYAATVAHIAADSGFIDFAHYYAFAMHVARGGDVFDSAVTDRLGQALGVRAAGAPLVYPPLFYVAMRPWTWLSFRVAALARLVALLASVALFQPLVETLHLGQANVLVLALMTLGWWGARNARPWLAAVALGLAVHVKPQFGLAIVALAWIGQRGIAYRAAAVAAAGVVVGAMTVGPTAYLDWARHVLAMPTYLHAWTLNMAPHAALHRLLDGVLGARAVEPLTLGASGAILAGIAYALRGRPAPGTPAFDRAFGLAVAGVPLVAPIAEEHHLVVLLLPLALLVLAADVTPRASVALLTAAVLIGARYSLERVPALHTGVPSLLLTGKLAGVALLARLLVPRAREAAR
jgi:hypothetical protein